MTKRTFTIFAILLIFYPALLTACNYLPAYTDSPITPQDGTSKPNTPAESTDTPEVTPIYEGCYFAWASQDLPELSKKFNDALQAINENATGRAYAYGENCVYTDGRATFGAMETDFSVEVRVADIKNEKALGEWMYKILQVIENLPPEEIQGGQPGMVQFKFVKSEIENLYLNVSLDEYRKQAQDLQGAELFRYFYNNP
ncbi:MAG: hypothetical protein HYX49_01390 [Chloroflexi bacterium]|nr:hypothetical protein [Chloroflexota bacterium]